MKFILISFLILGFSVFSQESGDKFNISGTFVNAEHPVKVVLLETLPDGKIITHSEQKQTAGYRFELSQELNYQIRFEYSPTLTKTITVIPRSSATYELNVNFDKKDKIHCILLYEDDDEYDMYLLTQDEYLELCKR